MKLKKSVKKKINLAIIIVVLIVILGIGFLVYKKLGDKKPIVTPQIVDKIGDYGYELEENMPSNYKKKYEELRKVLKEDEINEESYAKLVAQLLVFDFYNLNDKISKNDIGGVQFIRKEQQKNFILEASETLYKYIEHNVYGNRNQELPEVKDVSVTEVKETSYKYKKITDDKCYKVTVEVSYNKDLGYPEEVEVVLIHNEENKNKLEVIKMY